MSRASDEIAFRAWVRWVLQTFDAGGHAVKVMYADQKRSARQVLPYATVLKLSESHLGMAHTRFSDGGADTADEELNRRYEATYSVVIYGEDHNDMAIALDQMVDSEATFELNESAGIVVVNTIAGPTRLSTNTNGVTEDRSRIDFQVRYNKTRITNLPDTIGDVDLTITTTTP